MSDNINLNFSKGNHTPEAFTEGTIYLNEVDGHLYYGGIDELVKIVPEGYEIIENNGIRTIKISSTDNDELVMGGASGNLYWKGKEVIDYGNIADATSNKMDKENPTGTGSLSIGRKSGTTVGTKSVALGADATSSATCSFAAGEGVNATGNSSHAEGYYTWATGSASHAEGKLTSAINEGAHSEGVNTTASRRASHAEGISSYHARNVIYNNSDGLDLYDPSLSETLTNDEILRYWNINNFSLANGLYGSHVEGMDCLALDGACHAEGSRTKALGYASHSEGFHSEAHGSYSHTEGNQSRTNGESAHAEGYHTSAINRGAHSEGENTTASRRGSHAEGHSTYIARDIIYNNSDGLDLYGQSLSENLSNDEILGYWNINNFSLANGLWGSHVEGTDCLSLGGAAHAEGSRTKALATATHSEGYYTEAHGGHSHVEGCKTSTSPNGQYSHAEGYSDAIARILLDQEYGEGIGFTKDKVLIGAVWGNGAFSLAHGFASHAEGVDTYAAGKGAHAEGYYTCALGDYSHTSGIHTSALNNQFALGHYNASSAASDSAGTNGAAFIIGNGSSTNSSTNRTNAFRVNYDGTVYTQSSTLSTGADYAEYFEWQDSNKDNEDRRGYFVTLDGDKIKIAESNDYILGIVSGQPAVLGNGDEDWRGRYIMDEFGAFITEDFEYEEVIPEEVIDEETGKTTTIMKTVVKTGKRYKQNPDYDPTLQYIQRADRPEWDAVGMLGVLSVRDDGTCRVNGYCKVAEGGIATASELGYRVIKRVNENIVKIIFK